MKKGDFIEEMFLKGRISKPVRKNEKYVWIIPTNDDFLREVALMGHPIGILKTNIIKVNGKLIKGENE